LNVAGRQKNDERDCWPAVLQIQTQNHKVNQTKRKEKQIKQNKNKKNKK
jgi:hypothetical protein